MEEGKSWIVTINEQLENMVNTSSESVHWSKQSIYKVPACVTELNKNAFKPQTVSFGPYHHGKDTLKAMEEHKRRALLHFLKRSNVPLTSYVKALTPVVQDLKDAYDQLDSKWQEDTDSFLELMIVDGCFMLEILWCATSTQTPVCNLAQRQEGWTSQNEYADNDPIFSDHGRLYFVPYLKRDMLMLENQLPILVLETLVEVAFKAMETGDTMKLDKKTVTKLILKFFQISVNNIRPFLKCLHVLDVYRKSLLLEKPRRKSRRPTTTHGGDEIIRSATELNEAGIQFKQSKSRSLKDISFHNGVIELPLIVVDDALESSYLNLIAFERFHVGAGNEVTSYIFFMDNIIDNARDVSLLHSCGIIQNALGSDKAVANLFNNLSKDVTLDPDSSLDEVHKQVSHYCQQSWNRWRANLMHNYFTNPWAILSVIAAVFLFALTIVQTVYSVLGYYPNGDSTA